MANVIIPFSITNNLTRKTQYYFMCFHLFYFSISRIDGRWMSCMQLDQKQQHCLIHSVGIGALSILVGIEDVKGDRTP